MRMLALAHGTLMFSLRTDDEAIQRLFSCLLVHCYNHFRFICPLTERWLLNIRSYRL